MVFKYFMLPPCVSLQLVCELYIFNDFFSSRVLYLRLPGVLGDGRKLEFPQARNMCFYILFVGHRDRVSGTGPCPWPLTPSGLPAASQGSVRTTWECFVMPTVLWCSLLVLSSVCFQETPPLAQPAWMLNFITLRECPSCAAPKLSSPFCYLVPKFVNCFSVSWASLHAFFSQIPKESFHI